jgi:ABC-type polysaccharide/polyol phosphate transport system ATPase subunit
MDMPRISVSNVGINFRLYHDRTPSLKEYFSRLFKKRKHDSYRDFSALTDINFDIMSGERVGIIGHNGAGKSTLLKTLCGIYEPTNGSVTVNGKVAPLLEIGAGFHPEFTGRENVYLNGAILGYTRAEINQIEPEVIAFAELEEFIDTPVKYYSTGMYMRLAFSLATATKPEILILDELFAGGDAGFVEKATTRMHSMVHAADIMILVSHDTNLLRTMCDRVIWLNSGAVKMDGEANEVIDCYLRNKQ